ncbi:putative NADH-flavin reductase [Chitinophaga skermanii]|uniref:Putative NADH-flavin reductase n=1 Tax=Chitinophaga skermanii TaxID=331697 RepID=A0A327QM75_9BACT|nr:SDR family oxidoreductase [Chitinophaga skermanii]RAJ05361.1 putative NADH-flavin reductase [Chitinophaga skermanii]
MKLVVFGATGATGKEIVSQALAKGHTVTAFARDPSKIEIKHPHLRIVKGDIFDTNSIEKAVEGQDAVLNAIGSPANKIGTIRSQGTYNIIKAMEKKGVKRLICQTSLGYGDSVKTLDRTPFIFKYIIVPFILKKGFADHALQESYVKASQLDWTIVRPGNLTNDAFTGKYKHGFPANDQTIKVKISRADVADFMLQQLSSTQYIFQNPGISY